MRHHKGIQYDRIIHSYRWQCLRREYIAAHPLCEDCEAAGRTALAQEVHHIVPIETAHTVEGMEALAFDRRNLRALCKPCHEAAHLRLGSNSKKGRKRVREAAKAQAGAFLARWCGKDAGDGPPGGVFSFPEGGGPDPHRPHFFTRGVKFQNGDTQEADFVGPVGRGPAR